LADRPDEPLQRFWSGAAERRVMLIPPGEYHLAVKPTQFDSSRLLWPMKFVVNPGEITTASLDSFLRLELPDGAGDIYSWEAAAADFPEQSVQRFSSGAAQRRAMLLPPGDYKLALRPQQFEGERLVWPETFTVEADRATSAALTSGIRLVGPPDAKPTFDVRILADGNVVQSAGDTWNVQVVPPGTYRVETRPHGQKQWQDLAESCEVKSKGVTELPYPGK
jgi:hypothetical protein